MFQMEDGPASSGVIERPKAHGRYLFLGKRKFFVKGVTYGPFPENENGEPLPSPEQVSADFRQMRETGVNSIRVYYVPPRWLLDMAARHGIYVMVGVPWPQHLCFLDQWEVKEQIKQAMRDAVAACGGHPALLAYLIGNEIPSHIVRWSGAKKIEKFLLKLTNIIREEDPGALVTYANYPSTEYLKLGFLDFLCFNVYLHEETAFRSYLKRLQNVAGELPLVLSEFGMDSLRHGEAAQAETIAWQVKAAFELGVSGTMVFAWTDEWYTGGHLIEDWAFGMVDAERAPKLGQKALKDVYAGDLPPLPAKVPLISVVVCAYNADTTMEGCLASFKDVEYPNFEVIVVDDGSTDKTAEISDRYAARYPFIQVIHQPNLGLSAARNVGLEASRGEIVAYTDSDCYVDPHWLHYMAWAFMDERFAAVGGPNLPPPEDNRTAACVAVSPGAPTHVLLTDEIAEHIPGCNMAFRRERLMEIAGFDVTYRAAGDDVDLCWRLQDQGHLIGFSAGMTVWHHRRNNIKAYLRQQKGYGRAEALLLPKHPERFNMLGNSRWAGRIYGDISGCLLAARPVIYHGVFGMGLFQTLYEPKGSLLAYLPLSFEWMALSLALMVAGLAFPAVGLAALCMAATTLAFVGHRASQAKLPKRHDNFLARLTIAGLTLAQPFVRGYTRYKTVISLRRAAKRSLRKGGLAVLEASQGVPMAKRRFTSKLSDAFSLLTHHFSFHRFFWNNKGLERDEALEHVLKMLKTLNVTHSVDSGYAVSSDLPPQDLHVKPGLWTNLGLRLTVENHGGEKRFIRMAGNILPTGTAGLILSGLFLASLVSLVAAPWWLALAPAAGFIGFAAWVSLELCQTASLVGTLSQYMMACKPGSSLDEPVIVKLRKQAAALPEENPEEELVLAETQSAKSRLAEAPEVLM